MHKLLYSFLCFFLSVCGLWTFTTSYAADVTSHDVKKITVDAHLYDAYPASGEKYSLLSSKNSTQQLAAPATCGTADPVKIVVLGSSTAAGFKVKENEAWVNRYKAYLTSLNPANEIVNLALGGYNTYHLMPNGFSKPNREAPDTERNITKAVSLNPDGIIINLPSNDAAKKYTAQEQMDNFAVMYQTAKDAGIPVWITTTQPRDKLNSAQNDIQEAVRDAVFEQYGLYALDFWTSVTEYRDGEPKIKEALNIDGVHVTPEGHRLFFEEVKSKLVYERIAQLYTSVKSGDYNSTGTWNLKTVPGSDALVTIAAGNTISLNQNISPRSLKLTASSTLDLKTYQLTIDCPWDMQGALNASQATLVLTGSEDMPLGKLTAIKNLIINKTDGTVTLGNDLTIAAALQLTKGNINLSGHHLTLAKPLLLTGGSAAAFVQTTGQGDLVYQLSNDVLTKALVFPVGDALHYTPFTLTLQSATLSNASLRMAVSDGPPAEAGTTDLLLSRQWNLRQQGLSDYLYDVSYQYLEEDIDATKDQSEKNLQVIKYSRELGWLMGGQVNASTNTLSAEGINSFGIFSGGNNIEGAKPLPVALLAFQAKATPQGGAYLTWSTASERNNHYFTVERSVDAEQWSGIAQVAGSSNSNDLKTYSFTDTYPLYGQSYYRLKQVDYDGRFAYSPIAAFYTDTHTPFQVKMGPNPVSVAEAFRLEVLTDTPDIQVRLEVCDILGKPVYQQSFVPAHGLPEVSLPTSLHRGIYMVTVRQGYHVSQQKLWIK